MHCRETGLLWRVAAARYAHATAHFRANVSCTCTDQYKNMREILKQDMRPVDLALEAYRRVGVQHPRADIPFRGGTDGSVLTLRGLPTPNIFAGELCNTVTSSTPQVH